MNLDEYIECQIEDYLIRKHANDDDTADAYAVKDGHGNARLACLGDCGDYGDGWGSRLGYCTTCKHLYGACNGIGCKTSRHA